MNLLRTYETTLGIPLDNMYACVEAHLDVAVGVKQVVAGGDAMAALKTDGSVLMWSNGSAARLAGGGVEQSVVGGSAMAALKRDGSVLTWGQRFCWRRQQQCRNPARQRCHASRCRRRCHGRIED